MEFLQEVRWSPYLVGAFIGLLNILAMMFTNKSLSASTSFLKVGGLLRQGFKGNVEEENPYYRKNTPEIDYGVLLVGGVVLGSFLSAVLSGSFRFEAIPPSFSGGFFLRWTVSILGGALLGFGARWAGGCTSGHGISGASQLSVLSWVALLAFFVGGVATALLLYGV